MNVSHPRPEAEIAPPSSLYASRVRVYPKAVDGPVRRIKWLVLALCLAIYYALPWLRWNRGPNAPHQAVLLDMWNERFYFFSVELWPQDIWFLAGLLALGAVTLFLITSLFGRLWCGYSCPQTVWTDLFMLVERKIEGDRNERIRRDRGPLTFDKAGRKIVKHVAWLFIAFWTGGAWVMYFVDAPTVVREFWTGHAATSVYVFTFLLTAMTYLLAGWAREQVCTYMCPWPRFQSAMLDENTFIVTYEAWRGEPRGHGKRLGGHETTALGDCVDCQACVHVCPTGIDIRDGVQLECISCGLCIDACNHVMAKTGSTPWLITWDTLARQESKKSGVNPSLGLLRPRTLIYLGVLTIGVIVLASGLMMRATIGLSVAHDRAPLYARLEDGGLRNGYTLGVINKTLRPAEFELRVVGLPDAKLILSEISPEAKPTALIAMPADSVRDLRVLVQAKPDHSQVGRENFDFVLKNRETGATAIYHAVFMEPHQS
ncbi:MAG: cytochrome c oxidase accessory protein CcoG [Acidibrevibacterium sp.]|uniref:cytochrome c oxidase accessory protein CcoG n=1 Tax=Acidibrevibacterium sp. TaxID=2606776 RepID=UPI003D031613